MHVGVRLLDGSPERDIDTGNSKVEGEVPLGVFTRSKALARSSGG